jgi:hypothetical protein
VARQGSTVVGAEIGQSRALKLPRTRRQIIRTVLIIAIAVLASACGLGSVHRGDQARIDVSGATGYDTEEAFSRLYKYVNKDHDIRRADQELTSTGHCTALKHDEIVSVLGESGDLRRVRRADGTELWTSWEWLMIVT